MRIVALHGFTGSAATMEAVPTALPDRDVVAVDLPGHGTNLGGPATMDAAVEQVIGLGAPLFLVGYSMGGRVALTTAVRHPGYVAGLLLVGASPGIADPEARAARARSDDALAESIERRGLDWFVDHWMSQPMFAGQGPTERAQRLRNDAAGLAASLRGMGTGVMEPLWEHLDDVAVPVHLVVGEHDDKFSAIADAMAARLPAATVETVAGAGHSVHVDAPARFGRIVRACLGASPA